jgi:hypothetical protein
MQVALLRAKRTDVIGDNAMKPRNDQIAAEGNRIRLRAAGRGARD